MNFPRQCPVCTYIMYRDAQAHDCAMHLRHRFDETHRELGRAKAELTEWRSGKRRVFWRVKLWNGPTHHAEWVGAYDSASRRDAWAFQRTCPTGCARVYRVTVGPAKPKEAK